MYICIFACAGYDKVNMKDLTRSPNMYLKLFHKIHNNKWYGFEQIVVLYVICNCLYIHSNNQTRSVLENADGPKIQK